MSEETVDLATQISREMRTESAVVRLLAALEQIFGERPASKD